MAQQLINGLIAGSMYALLALGYSLVFGLLNRLNIAHGDVFMSGGFAGLAAFTLLDAPAWLAVVVAFVVTGLVGILVELACFKPLEKYHSEITAALSTVAFGIALTEVIHIIWGTEPVALPREVGQMRLNWGGVEFSVIQLVILAVSLFLMLALYFAVMKTKVGREIRAVAESPTSSALLGINLGGVIRSTFFISSALAGVAGILYAMRIGVVSPQIGLTFGIKALAIMAIGGIGDMRGSMVAGLLIGVIEALAYQFGLGGYAELIVWMALILTLIFKPSGLFGGYMSREARV